MRQDLLAGAIFLQVVTLSGPKGTTVSVIHQPLLVSIVEDFRAGNPPTPAAGSGEGSRFKP
jgi:hypothetical protein